VSVKIALYPEARTWLASSMRSAALAILAHSGLNPSVDGQVAHHKPPRDVALTRLAGGWQGHRAVVDAISETVEPVRSPQRSRGARRREWLPAVGRQAQHRGQAPQAASAPATGALPSRGRRRCSCSSRRRGPVARAAARRSLSATGQCRPIRGPSH
jgi:hypothetical protein